MEIIRFDDFMNEAKNTKKSKKIDLKILAELKSGGVEKIDYAKNKDKKLIDLSPLDKKAKKDNGYRGDKITYAESQVFHKAPFLTTDDDVHIYKIDAEYVRDNIDIDYTMGGHGYVYPNYIPENEVWIEDTMDDEDIFTTAIHELTERREMKTKGVDYSTAHDTASAAEKKFRKELGEERIDPYGKKKDERKDNKEGKK